MNGYSEAHHEQWEMRQLDDYLEVPEDEEDEKERERVERENHYWEERE